MGRHSAPDDDADDLAQDRAGVAVALDDAPRGQHARPDDDADAVDEPALEGLGLIEDALAQLDPRAEPVPEVAHSDAPTTTITPIVDPALDVPLPQETTARIPAVAEGSGPAPTVDLPGQAAVPVASERATTADLHLIRQHADVRARVLAAVVAPFVVFVVVLVITNKLQVHMLVWIWAPAVAAGVLVGLLLDAGHKRYAPGPDAGTPDALSEPADPA